MKGSFDLHVHAGPDGGQERRMDALEAARTAYESQMAGFILKSHYHPTAPLAYTLGQIYPGLKIYGAIVLNWPVGGINPDAVDVSVDLGAKVVWMPTFSSSRWRGNISQDPSLQITDDKGKLKKEVHDVLEIIKDKDVALASGHVSPSETLTLFRAARTQGIQRIIATHPYGLATVEEQKEMASLGAYLEYTFLSCMTSFTQPVNSPYRRLTPDVLIQMLLTIGVERCVVTTDFGQWMNPPPSEGMRMAIATLLAGNMTVDDIAILVKRNPLSLVE